MDFKEKQRLAWHDDNGLAACAIRLRAARGVTGLKSHELAKECDVSKTVYSNAETGQTYPNRKMMKHLYRAYRIDFNFMINGDFAQLPGDVQDALFAQLVVANDEWDRRSSSGPAPRKGRGEPAKSS